MNCDTCVKILPLPECIEGIAYNPYYLEGLTFTDTDTNMIAKVRDMATGKMEYIEFETDSGGDAVIDLFVMFPLMDHVYTIEFVNAETGNPEDFTITNADSTTSVGCCIEFGVSVGQTDNNGFFTVSSQGCAV